MTMPQPVQIRGHNGTVIFDGVVVTIARTGFLARSSVGKGCKSIPVRQITSVQLKPVGPLMNGFRRSEGSPDHASLVNFRPVSAP